MSECDPQRVHAVHQALLAQLAAALHDDWQWAYEAHQVHEAYEPSPEQSGRRALANLGLAMCVAHAVHTGNAVWPGRAYQRVKDATQMTDRYAALEALVNAHAELAAPALQRFHAQFAGQALVVDKWFRVQAQAPEHGDGRVLQRVRELARHADFTLANPNRARALLQAFAQNPGAFHRADGAGYALWAEQVIQADAVNPKLASRLARALDRWRALAEPYRSAARGAIAHVAQAPRLSADVAEIVNKALEE